MKNIYLILFILVSVVTLMLLVELGCFESIIDFLALYYPSWIQINGAKLAPIVVKYIATPGIFVIAVITIYLRRNKRFKGVNSNVHKDVL